VAQTSSRPRASVPSLIPARVYIDHSSVSRQHARIVVHTDGVTLEDLDSRNGTFLNGRRVSEPEAIQDGALIGLGPCDLHMN
jgi:FOG: FHA domain